MKQFSKLIVEVMVSFHIDPASRVQHTFSYMGDRLIAP